MSSILDDTKKVLGLEAEYKAFDLDIIMHINSVLATLEQIGVGPFGGFSIKDSSAQWETYLGNQPMWNSVKTYVYLRVRLLFDPPSTSYLITAYKEQAQEIEWRLSAQREAANWISPEPVLDGGNSIA